jgi:hypothetical protein
VNGPVIDLEGVRRRRDLRRLAAAHLAPLHPALRWSADGGSRAHRRTAAGAAACGAAGELRLAPEHAELCPDCHPSADVS